MSDQAVPGHAAAVGDGVVELAPHHPEGQLVDLHLAQLEVLLAVEDGGVVGSVDRLREEDVRKVWTMRMPLRFLQ